MLNLEKALQRGSKLFEKIGEIADALIGRATGRLALRSAPFPRPGEGAARELTGRSKARNGDFRPFGAVSRRPERCVAAKPGSGDGKVVGKAAKPGAGCR